MLRSTLRIVRMVLVSAVIAGALLYLFPNLIPVRAAY
jgi:hypothetical protein